MSETTLPSVTVDQELLSDNDNSPQEVSHDQHNADVVDKPKPTPLPIKVDRKLLGFEPTQQESEQLLHNFMRSDAWTKRFGTDGKLRGLTRDDWLKMAPFIIKWHNRSNTDPLPQQVRVWTAEKLRDFAMELTGSWSPVSCPYFYGSSKQYGPYRFEAGTMREDAPLRAKRVKLNSDGSAKKQEEAPKQQSFARSQGAPVFVTIMESSQLPRFLTLDQFGKQVSNSIVEYDLALNTVDELVSALSHHDYSCQDQVETRNSDVIIYAARFELFMSHCPEDEKMNLYRSKNRFDDKVCNPGPILFEQLDDLLWEWESSRRDVLTQQAQKYIARITELNAAGRKQLGL
jgi:hypothetical protein